MRIMPGRLLNCIKIMNVISVSLFVVCCLHCLLVMTKAQADPGALTVVAQEDDDNDVTVEVNGEESQVDQVDDEPFHPTEEWKALKPGQRVPAGLHIRLNLETGEREAKLMDGDKRQDDWSSRHGMPTMDKKQYSAAELKEALKDFKTNQIDSFDKEKAEKVKQKFRSYDELREDFHNMNMDIKTDGEILTGLVKHLESGKEDTESLLTILADLEYYLHQIDNAVLFKDIGGLSLIIKLLNTSAEDTVKTESAMVLGSALQSNPQVQIAALEESGMQVLLRLMTTTKSQELRKKLLYAVSSFIRHFPYAQRRFLEYGGLITLGDLFREEGAEKICVKATTLLNDLLMEKEYAEGHTDESIPSEKEKLKQYQEVNLLEEMQGLGWCDLIPALLDVPDHDSNEKILSAMKTLKRPCKSSFQQAESKLVALRKEYIQLAEEDEEEYFTTVLESVTTVLAQLHVKDEL